MFSLVARTRWSCVLRTGLVGGALCAAAGTAALAQTSSGIPSATEAESASRADRFLAGRTTLDGTPAASAMNAARSEHLQMLQARPASVTGVHARTAQPRVTPLSTTWTSVGPAQIASQRYGLVTGRVTSIAVDPADPTGNTVYVGTTGGGVWKSTNAAGPVADVSFAPLTDTLPVFSANSGTAALPSLSIGALSVANGVVLAGTGDPNDGSDSYYGEGILRSTDGRCDVDSDPALDGRIDGQPRAYQPWQRGVRVEHDLSWNRGRGFFVSP